ncbi:MAG: cobalt-precorrin-5B (C(1))-methyltransferase CbiD [Desulfobacterales bacterium]|nr:cobalt-precorrin-5B (C(1))-methyltransferase CbiD [Desulfobacterales bacterium]
MNRKRHKKLRSGFTTGTAAAAAAKGALALLFEKKPPASVPIRLPTGDQIIIPLKTCALVETNVARCSVIKDAGDDPDITHRAEIGATVTILANGANKVSSHSIQIKGGVGVGTVTKPGLEIAPGEPAINPVPRKMIRQAIGDVCQTHQTDVPVAVEVFVPEGQKLAEKTLNARLGIIGGISILGTTGIVKPLSHGAYIATIKAALSVAKASGARTVVLTTGRRSERYAQQLWTNLAEEAFVQIGDFFRMSLESAASSGFKELILAVFFGKAVKMAQGVPHTHAAKSSLSLRKLAKWSLEVTGDKQLSEKILSANTARHVFDFLYPDYPAVIDSVGKRIIAAAQKYAVSDIDIHAVIFDYNGQVAFSSKTKRDRSP